VYVTAFCLGGRFFPDTVYVDLVSLDFNLLYSFTAWCCADHGYAMVNCLSVSHSDVTISKFRFSIDFDSILSQKW